MCGILVFFKKGVDFFWGVVYNIGEVMYDENVFGKLFGFES